MSEALAPEQENRLGTRSFESAYNRLLSERGGILASEWGGELEWLKNARERDFGRWCAEGLPTRKNERWHYTSVAPIANAEVKLPSSAAVPARESLVSLKSQSNGQSNGQSAADIVFMNGQFVPELSSLAAGEGISVEVLSDLLEKCVSDGWSAERIQRFAAFRTHVETSDADRETVFAAINTSFMQDVVLVHVRPNVKIERPIVIAYISSSEAEGNDLPMVTPRVFVHVDHHAEVAVLEVYEGRDGCRYFSNSVSDLRLDEGARLSYCKVQLEGSEAYHVGATRIHQARSSFSEAFQFSFGAKLSRQDLHINLDGEGAEAVLDGLYMVTGRQHVDNHTAVDHVVPHTTSSQVYKGILDQEARAVFNGFVHIHKDAQKSSATQLNNNLVLSMKAEVDTKPELEIDADDVKAAHGATVGQMDPEHVFYLETRGIPRQEAVRLLARGFAQDIVFRIGHDPLRDRMRAIVDTQFDKMQIAQNESRNLSQI